MKKAHFTIKLGIVAACFPLPACAPGSAYDSMPYGTASHAAASYSERGIAPGFVGVFENGRLVERSIQEVQMQEQNEYRRETAPRPPRRIKPRRTVQKDNAAKRRAAEEERLLEESRRKAQRRKALDYLKY